jgi:hypothetical protein
VLATVANVPRNDQLGVGINRGPRPDVASAFRGSLGEFNVLLLGVAEDQISSHWTALKVTPRTVLSWKAAQASPASTSSLETVLIETPVIRETERMDDPSQSIGRIW